MESQMIDVRYRAYAELLLRYHKILMQDGEDSSASEAAEDAMNAVWTGLDPVQQVSLNGVASDLIWIRENGSLPPRGKKRENITEEDKTELLEALLQRQYQKALDRLRTCAAAIAPEKLALQRSQAYRELGLLEIAAEFKSFVARLSATESNIGEAVPAVTNQRDSWIFQPGLPT